MTISRSLSYEKPIKELSQKHQGKNYNCNDSAHEVYQFTREFDEY